MRPEMDHRQRWCTVPHIFSPPTCPFRSILYIYTPHRRRSSRRPERRVHRGCCSTLFRRTRSRRNRREGRGWRRAGRRCRRGVRRHAPMVRVHADQERGVSCGLVSLSWKNQWLVAPSLRRREPCRGLATLRRQPGCRVAAGSLAL